jgi:hypothetical protein
MASHPPHRVATVREALDLLLHIARDLPEEGPFEDVVVEICGDPALGSSPDPEAVPDPLTWLASVTPFTDGADVLIAPGWERQRALRLRIASKGGGNVRTLLRGAPLDELREELAAHDMERALYSTFHEMAEHYIDRMESRHP